MEGKGLLPDLVTYSTLIKAYERAGQWERALEVMKVMQDNNITPNVITYSTAISAVAKAGQWRAALGLLEHMRKDKVQPDAVTYNYVISALSKGGQWDAALRLLQECLDIEGQEAAQMSTYCTVIKCLGDNGEWEKALGVIGAMEGKAITPTSEVIEVLIDALENCKQTTLAQELRDKLKSRKILNKG
jgi:pentatricopeptide repeat domain-containing protein 1